MTDLFWPGDERAGQCFTEAAFLDAMVAVESAWLSVLIEAGLAPASASASLPELVTPDDVAAVAAASESGGNPVIPLVALLRDRVRPHNVEAATWVHRGLTSQDVVDTALVLCARDAMTRIDELVRVQVASLTRLAREHRDTTMPGRTLTQHAVPITFGLKVAGWLDAVLAAGEGLRRVRASLVAQVGGAAGTLAASTEMFVHAGGVGSPKSVGEMDSAASRSMDLAGRVADRLDLAPATPWHTSRGPMTLIGDAFVTCTDAWGRAAADIATGSRPEIAELAEATGGGSSTMPNKRNPVMSVLVRRAAIAAPALASTLHSAAALADDERPDGSWHVEWSTLATLARRTIVAASQAAELFDGLIVDERRMEANVEAAGDALFAEQRSMAALYGAEPSDGGRRAYRGAADPIIDAVLRRADDYLEETP